MAEPSNLRIMKHFGRNTRKVIFFVIIVGSGKFIVINHKNGFLMALFVVF